MPGVSSLPDREFAAQRRRFGQTSAERYEATQRQRALERAVRLCKRRVAVGRGRGLDMTAERLRLGRLQARLRAHVADRGLVRDYARERAYGVAAQPRALRSTAGHAALAAAARASLGIGSGGLARGPMEVVGRIDPSDRALLAEAVRQCRELVRHQPVEHAWVIQADGIVLHASGDEQSVSLGGADLEGARVIHNHPLVEGASVSFGKDDFEVARANPGMAFFCAASPLYDYSLRVLRPIDVGYDEAVARALGGLDTGALIGLDMQHEVMRWLCGEGYLRYRRKAIPDK